MDTIYYNLNAKRVKVSGGADLLTFVPTPAERPAGEVLDFERCHRRLETKAAWKDLERAAEPAPEVPVRPARRRDQAAGWLELAASIAVILVGIAASVAFFSLV